MQHNGGNFRNKNVKIQVYLFWFGSAQLGKSKNTEPKFLKALDFWKYNKDSTYDEIWYYICFCLANHIKILVLK